MAQIASVGGGARSARPTNKWGVLFSVVFGLFMVILDSTVVNVAFPTLRREYGVSVTDSQWILSVYTMSLGVATPLAGFLADRFGIKRIYLVGLAIFVAGSFLCGIAPAGTYDILGTQVNGLAFVVAARAVQAFGGGIALPLGTAVLFSTFRPEEQGTALGVFGLSLVLAPALGPILGGWLVDNDLWRWIFFINLPIGALGVLLASIFLRERKAERRVRLDLLGFITSAIGFGAVLYGASIAADEGWTAPKTLLFFGIGAAGLLLFGIVELFVAREPLLDLRLYLKPVFLIATLVGYVGVTALFGAEFLMPLYLQTLRGKTAFESGLLVLPLALASGFVVPLAGRIYDKIGPRALLALGFGVLAINTWQFSQLSGDTDINWILFLLALRGVAIGLTVQTTLTAALSVVPVDRVARGSALSNATRQVVQSIAVAVLATILAGALSQPVKDFQKQFQERPPAAGAKPFALCDPDYGALPPISAPSGSPGGPPPGVAQLLKDACDQSVRGFDNAYTLTFYFSLAALALGLLLPGWPLRWGGRRVPGRDGRALEEGQAGEDRSATVGAV